MAESALKIPDISRRAQPPHKQPACPLPAGLRMEEEIRPFHLLTTLLTMVRRTMMMSSVLDKRKEVAQ